MQLQVSQTLLKRRLESLLIVSENIRALWLTVHRFIIVVKLEIAVCLLRTAWRQSLMIVVDNRLFLQALESVAYSTAVGCGRRVAPHGCL